MSLIRLEADENSVDERIDKYLGAVLSDQSRSFLQKLIREGGVLVNGKPVKASYRVDGEDQIEIFLPEPETPVIPAENIPLDILYEDKDLLIVNKPKGMVVHPAAGHRTGTLVNAVLYHCRGQLSGINGVMRPGIVHRIDRDTTGALVVCKNDRAHNHVANQLKEHTITRRYVAVVAGVIREEEGTVDAPIGRHPTERKKMAAGVKNGKRAVTHYRVLQRFRAHTLIECRLETGRTHQIRVHMQYLGHPLVGDFLYCSDFPAYQKRMQRQALHSHHLQFQHPITGQQMSFTSPLPPDMAWIF